MNPGRSSSTDANPITDNLDLWSSATKKKATVGRGNNGKTSPHGINKLRELILEMAVRGKLVPQDPNDEPASVLLEKIAEEKERLVKEGLLKKQKTLPNITDSERSVNLPSGWEWTHLGLITNYGVTEKVEPGSVDDDTWVLELEDIEKVTSKLLRKVRNKERQFRSSKNRFIAGDILYGKLRPYLDKVLMAHAGGVCTTEIMPIRGYGGSSPAYLRLLLKSPSFMSYANESTHGMNLPRLGTDKARLALLPLAPTNEQHRIVAKVDELMALCDQLEQQQTDSLHAHQTLVRVFLDRMVNQANTSQPFHTKLIAAFDTLFTTEESIDELKQTILQLAVMGKLVPQNPNDEPASELLNKIAAEKEQLIKDKKIKRQKPLPPISDEEKPFELPRGWKWVFLSPLITIMDAGWSPACPPEKSPANDVWGVLKTTAVQTMEYRQDENKVLSESKMPRPQYEVKPGDILITRAGPKSRVGISCLVEATRPNLMISDKIIRFHLVNVGMSERFISLCFNAGATADYLERSKSGMAESQMNISQDKLKSAPIPLCPIEEQHRIVAKVDELMALCDTLKAHLNEAQTTQTQLADAVVEQAVG